MTSKESCKKTEQSMFEKLKSFLIKIQNPLIPGDEESNRILAKPGILMWEEGSNKDS